MNVQKTKPRTIYAGSGRIIHLFDPKPESIDIGDIANALSKLCRFTGHTSAFYSVAQHSVLVSWHVPHHLALQGLLHDAHEAYLGDVSSPLKSGLPDYKVHERRFERVLREKYGLPAVLDPCIKVADLESLLTEWRDLMPPGDLHSWTGDLKPWGPKIIPWEPALAQHNFLERFHDLSPS